MLTLNGRQTLTPPRSSTTLTKLVRASSMKWSRWMPVCCSTVFHRHDGPPLLKTALIRSNAPGLACCPAQAWPAAAPAAQP